MSRILHGTPHPVHVHVDCAHMGVGGDTGWSRSVHAAHLVPQGTYRFGLVLRYVPSQNSGLLPSRHCGPIFGAFEALPKFEPRRERVTLVWLLLLALLCALLCTVYNLYFRNSISLV